MQNLYNELISGEVEFKGDKAVRHPPTALMLRAARAIQALQGENQRNVVAILALQARESEALEVIETLRKELTKDKNEYLQCVCNSQQKASDVGSGGMEPCGSDLHGEGSTTG